MNKENRFKTFLPSRLIFPDILKKLKLLNLFLLFFWFARRENVFLAIKEWFWVNYRFLQRLFETRFGLFHGRCPSPNLSVLGCWMRIPSPCVDECTYLIYQRSPSSRSPRASESYRPYILTWNCGPVPTCTFCRPAPLWSCRPRAAPPRCNDHVTRRGGTHTSGRTWRRCGLCQEHAARGTWAPTWSPLISLSSFSTR